MDIKDIEVGKTYRFKNEETGPWGLPQFNGGTARVVQVDLYPGDPFPVRVNIAKGTDRVDSLDVKAEELEEL